MSPKTLPECTPCENARKHKTFKLPTGTHCQTCHLTWTSPKEAHCVACHEHFSSNEAADSHWSAHEDTDDQHISLDPAKDIGVYRDLVRSATGVWTNPDDAIKLAQMANARNR